MFGFTKRIIEAFSFCSFLWGVQSRQASRSHSRITISQASFTKTKRASDQSGICVAFMVLLLWVSAVTLGWSVVTEVAVWRNSLVGGQFTNFATMFESNPATHQVAVSWLVSTPMPSSLSILKNRKESRFSFSLMNGSTEFRRSMKTVEV